MRHNKSFNHLGRKKAHRKAMLSNMASSLIMHKRINTTVAKAKALKVFVEPLITRSKEDSTHNRRVVFRAIQDKNAVSELFREVSVKVGDRPGGYTRILKTGTRVGDAAEMCIIELVDYNENMLAAKETAPTKKRTRRGRTGATKTEADKVVEKAVEEAPVEDVKAEEVVEEVKKQTDETPKADDSADKKSDEEK